MTIVYILLFIVCLSTLIMVHEAGHLATAKIFKVYCFEYSIGFGPKIFSVRRKSTETAFSLRAIPFGGFVSMYGEEETIPEGYEPIDPSRSLNAIKKWKKCIILVAGVVMNFVLAITIFFVYEVAFPAHTARVAHITVNKDSIAYEVGLRLGHLFLVEMHEIVAEGGRQGCQSAVGTGITRRHETDDKNNRRELAQREGHRGEDLVVDHHTNLVYRQLESCCLGIINQSRTQAEEQAINHHKQQT